MSDSKKPKGKATTSRNKGKPKAGAPNVNKSGNKRLRPGELDGLVLAYLRRHKSEGPLTATVVGKGIKRSSGAVANCLERQAKAQSVRRANGRPRRYGIAEPKAKKATPTVSSPGN